MDDAVSSEPGTGVAAGHICPSDIPQVFQRSRSTFHASNFSFAIDKRHSGVNRLPPDSEGDCGQSINNCPTHLPLRPSPSSPLPTSSHHPLTVDPSLRLIGLSSLFCVRKKEQTSTREVCFTLFFELCQNWWTSKKTGNIELDLHR